MSPIDDYIFGFPPDIRKILKEIKKVISNAAPGAEETMSYGIPTFKMRENLVHFAGFKNHIGFYPTPSAVEAFKDELSTYKSAKGSVQFPLDKPIPYNLITQIVKFRIQEITEKDRK